MISRTEQAFFSTRPPFEPKDVTPSPAPKRCIGGSGTSAGRSNHDLTDEVFEGFNTSLTPFFVTLIGVMLLALWQLLFSAMPGCKSPLGKTLQLPCMTRCATATLAFSVASPSLNTWKWHSNRKRRQRRPIVRSWIYNRAIVGVAWLCGFLSLPIQVWAAPAGLPEAIATVQALSNACPARFVDASAAWPEPFASPAASEPATDDDRAHKLRYERRGIGVIRHEDATRGPPDWVGVSLFAPYYQPEHWAIQLSPPATAQQAHETVMYVLQDAFHGNLNTAVPTNPQRFDGCLHYLCFPSFLDSAGSSGVAVIIDASRVGGHYFAAILAGVLTYEQLAAFVRPLTNYGFDDFDFTIGAEPARYGPGSHLTLDHGDVVTVVMPTTHGPSSLTPATILSAPASFNPLHQVPWDIRTPDICLLFQGERFLLDPAFQSGRSVTEAVSFVLDLDESRWIAQASKHFDNLDVQGTPCDRLLAAFKMPPVRPEDPVTRGRRDIWVFLDFRPIGHRPQAIVTNVFRVHIPSLLAHFGIHIPDDYSLSVEGGISCGDEILLESRTTLVFKASASALSSASGPDNPPDSPPANHHDEAHDSHDPDSDSQGGNDDRDHSENTRVRDRSRSPRTEGSPGGPAAELLNVLKCTDKLCSPQVFDCYMQLCANASFCKDWQLALPAMPPSEPGLPLLAPAEGSCSRLWCRFDLLHANLVPLFSIRLDSFGACKTMKGHSGPGLHVDTRRVQQAAERGLQISDIEQEPPAQAEQLELHVQAPDAGAAQADMFPIVDVRCLIYAPEYVPDMLVAPLVLPCSVEHATAVFSDVREESQADNFADVFPAAPQPVRECAIFVAAPAWFRSKVVVLFNLQAINACIFSAAVHHRLNKASLLTIAEIREPERFEVYVHGLSQALPADLWIDLHNGCTVTVVETGQGPPPGWQLHDMLQDPEGWDHRAEVPGPGGSPGDHFWVLNDGKPFRFDVRVGRRAYVRPDICRVLQFTDWRTTLKPSIPRIIDHLSCGYISSGVLVATEMLSRVPYPPARVPEKRKILILDCRAILQGFQWQFFTGDRVVLQHLADQFADVCPLNFLVVFKGAEIAHTPEGLSMTVQHGAVIKVEFQEEHALDEQTEDEDNAESEASEDSDTSLPGATDEENNVAHQVRTPDNPHTRGRSRSPRVHASPQNFATSDEQRGTNLEILFVETAFAILTPGFPVESVAVRLQIPTSIDEAVARVQQARQGWIATQFPDITPAIRQPDACWGVMLTVPTCCWWKQNVCFFECTEQPRIFACSCPAIVDRNILLELAGISDHSSVVIVCDLFGPLTGTDTCEVVTGSVITFLPEGQTLPWTMSLRSMLQTHLPWHTPPAFPSSDEDDVVLLACHHGQELLSITPDRATQYRQDIAALARCHPRVLMIASATPRPSNVYHQGYKCRTVVAAADIGPYSAQDSPCICLLDARSIFKGWIPIITRDGWIDTWSLLQDFSSEVDRQWTLMLEEHNPAFRWYHTQIGSVLTLTCHQFEAQNSSQQFGDQADTRTRHTARSDDGHDHPTDGGTDASHTGVGRRQSQPSTSSHGLSVNTALQGLIGYTILGTNDAQHLDADDQVEQCVFGSVVDKWGVSFVEHALAEGRRHFTPVILCLLLITIVVYLTAYTNRGRGCRAGFRTPLAFLVGMHLIPISTAARHQAAVDSCVHGTPSLYPAHGDVTRPVPTPCRSRHLPQLQVPQVDCVNAPGDLQAHAIEELTTLLEQSIRADATPFFLASTLVETLFEHFAQAGHPITPAGLCGDSPHVDVPFCLSSDGDNAQPSQLLCLHQAIGPETFDLTAQTVQLPHSAQEAAVLMAIWPPTWLAPDLGELDLPLVSRNHVANWQPWPAFVFNLPWEARPTLHIFTDGSWTADAQIGGYAVVLVLEWNEESTIYGLLGEQTHGSDLAPWPLDGPPALRNEEIAVMAALLWLVQSRTICRPSSVFLHYDCHAAGLTAAGEWSPNSSFAGKLRNIQRWLDALLDAPIQYVHVKAHNGHPLNETPMH